MKHSKIFLAVTTGLLAFTVIAAKSTRWNHIKAVGYCTSSRLLCTAVGSLWYTINSAGAGSKVATCGNSKILYSVKRTTIKCSGNVLFTKAAD